MDYSSSGNIEKSLDVTEQLMLGYYKEYGLCWDRSKRRRLLESAEHYHILEEGTFVGFFAFFENEDHVYVCDLEVLPEYQNKGFGGAAMRFIFNQAVSRKLRFVRLSVFKSNDAAMRFYEKHGFTVLAIGNVDFRLQNDIAK